MKTMVKCSVCDGDMTIEEIMIESIRSDYTDVDQTYRDELVCCDCGNIEPIMYEEFNEEV
jgi:hypothetical protein